ncbi:MAG: nitrile hydratase accessory protein [Polyangiales bacterium]
MSEELLDVTGTAAPPRQNGELVFEAPWERRVFGLTMALVERGAIEYARFREHLIAEIAAWEADHPPEESWSYYRCWARALESLLNQQSAVRSSELETRVEALAQRPHGHDHG